ncbi:BCCT family transporter, partial [Clostridium sp.]|uniref:BCCT family transporter n=1 Tax=Clostridium sp. TaxID=1506 RepID=UPI001A4E4E45
MEKGKNYSIRKAVLIPMVLVFAGIIFFGITNPVGFFNAEKAISAFGYNWFAWLYILVTLMSMAVLIWLVFSRFANIKIGGEDCKPIYTRFQWFTVCLCGIIGTGMVIWGIAEPITFLWEPVTGVGVFEPGSANAAKFGLATSLIHWGVPSIALYTIMGVVFGFVVYNMKLPFRISSLLYPILGKKSMGRVGDIVDNFSFFSISVSVAAVLAVAATTVGAGVSMFFGVESTTILRGSILLVLVISFIASSYTGLLRGIRILSDINTKIFIGLIIFVFVFGGTRFILSMSTEALGLSAQTFFQRMTYLGTVEKDMFPMWWTVVYWVWMVVYGPMMGLFLAKIGRGRTLREFIIVNMLPAFFIMLWFCVFGSSAINMELTNGGQIYATMGSSGLEAAVFAFFKQLPLSSILGVGFILILCISVVTCVDGLTSTVSSLSVNCKDGGTAEPPTIMKIFWGVVMASVAFVSIFANTTSVDGINMLNAAKMLPMIGALPMLAIYVVAFISLFKFLSNREKYDVTYFPETAIVEK